MAADFERACEGMRTPLHVLPPRQPQWNGCVERANRSQRTVANLVERANDLLRFLTSVVESGKLVQ